MLHLDVVQRLLWSLAGVQGLLRRLVRGGLYGHKWKPTGNQILQYFLMKVKKDKGFFGWK